MKFLVLRRNQALSSVVAFVACICLSTEVSAQYFPGGQQGQQGQSTSGRLLQRLRQNIDRDKQIKEQQEKDKKAQEDAYRQALSQGLCPPPLKTTQGPEQRGKSNDWHNFTNMMHRLPNGASANMGGENNAFKNHMGAERAGLDVTGGSKLTSVADSLGKSNYQGPTAPPQTTNASANDIAAQYGGKVVGPGQ